MTEQKIDRIRFYAYLLAFVLIAAFPVVQIWKFEFPGVPPKAYFFRTQAFDPYDLMRGRYVRLSFTGLEVRLPGQNKQLASYGNPCYAVLGVKQNGDAEIVGLCLKREEIPQGRDFLPVHYHGYFQEWDKQRKKPAASGYHTVGLPFDRFYMNEKAAPEAEGLVRRHTGKGSARLKVLIHADGTWQVDDLLLNGKPIRQVIRSGSAGNP